jgi:hypothetical protein
MISLNGDIRYIVQLRADVCNPTIGSTWKCRVKNTNKFGILATIAGENHAGSPDVVDIIISKEGTFASDVGMSEIRIGDTINVEILGKKFKIGEKKITAVGRLVHGEAGHEGGAHVNFEGDDGNEEYRERDDNNDESYSDDENEDGEVDDESVDEEINEDVVDEEDDVEDGEDASIGGLADDLEDLAPSITSSAPADDIDELPDDASEYDI